MFNTSIYPYSIINRKIIKKNFGRFFRIEKRERNKKITAENPLSAVIFKKGQKGQGVFDSTFAEAEAESCFLPPPRLPRRRR